MLRNPFLSDSLSSTDPVDLMEKVIVTLINIFYVAGAIIFFFMLVFGGIEWLSSGGDKQRLADAQARIRNAIVGFIVLMSVFALVSFIETAFDVNILYIDTDAILSGEESSCANEGDACSLGNPCCNNEFFECVSGTCQYKF